tara:strand:+ start:10877 stop:12178 length:1302 start_codon:yes stop_codon:yes gene_type:complete
MSSVRAEAGSYVGFTTGWIKWGGWSLLVSIFVSGFFFRFAPATLAGSIREDLHLTATALGIVASMHFWVYTLMQIPAGILADSIGIRNGALAGGAVTGVGAVLFALAPGMSTLTIGSAMMGLGLSAVFVSLMKYNAVWFSVERHSLIMGASMLLAAAGSVVAQSPTAHLLTLFSWRQIVMFFGGITFLATIGLIAFCRDSPDQGKYRKKPSRTATRLLLQGNRLILRSRQIWLLFLCVAATNGTFYAFLGLWAVPLLTDGFGATAIEGAQYASVSLIIYGIGSLFAGWISDRIRARKPIIVGAAVLSAAVWAYMAFGEWTPGWGAMILFALLGLSGAQVGVIFSATKESVQLPNVGFAIALVNMGAFLAAAMVQSGFGMALDFFAAGETMRPSLQSYKLALILPLILGLIGMLASLFLTESAPGSPACQHELR